MTTHIWKLIVHKETLWVKWIHAYKLKRRNFWDVKIGANISWGWRKMLSIRPILQPYFWSVIGSGEQISAWFDKWNNHGPLISHVTNRAIMTAGFTTFEKLNEIIKDGQWAWPQRWEHDFPSLTLFSVPGLNVQVQDKLVWRTDDGCLHDFSVSTVWNSIRRRDTEVLWYKLVWSCYSIPRHAIHVWLVMKRRLKTQDRLHQWDVGNNVDLSTLRCFLCKLERDSHDHLFFDCLYSKQVWMKVTEYAKVTCNNSNWNSIVSWAVPITQDNKIGSIVVRLVFAASCYYIWQERNNRLFEKPERCPEVLVNVIIDSIRMKLASIKFKRKRRVQQTMKIWKIAWQEE